MCIIVVKPADVDVPSIDTFKTCFKHNSDGAGMMIAHDGTVYGDKGFMKFEDFKQSLKSYAETYGDLKSHAMVFHFRIGTHGTNTPGNTHPFPLKYPITYDEMKATHWEAKQGFAHNGILSNFGYHKDVKKYDVSDTMVYGKYVAALLSSIGSIPKHADCQFVLDKVATGKFAYLDGDGNLFTIGTFTEEKGVMYSNSSYKEYTYTKWSNGSANKYARFYDDYYGTSSFGNEWNDEFVSTYNNLWKTNKVKDSDHTKESHLLQKVDTADTFRDSNYLQTLTGESEDSSYSKYVYVNGKKKKTGTRNIMEDKRSKARLMKLDMLNVPAVLLLPEDDPDYYDFCGLELDEYEYAFSDLGTIYYWDGGSLDWEVLCSPEMYWVEDDHGEVIYEHGEFDEIE